LPLVNLLLKFHQLSIGGKEIRKTGFQDSPRRAINVSVIRSGHRYRMIVNEVEVVKCPEMQIFLLQAYVETLPDLKTGAAAWIIGWRSTPYWFQHFS